MKNWLTQGLSLCALAALGLTACKKDEVQATLTPNNMPTLAASTNTAVLTQANSAKTAITYTYTPVTGFSWTGTDHTYDPSLTYTLQIDKQGNNFAAPVAVNATPSATVTLTVSALNDVLTSLGITPGTATGLEARLVTSYATNAPMYSAVLPLTATGYLFICYPPTGAPTWALIGPAGVDWNTDVPLKYNCNTNTFDVTRALNAGAFKFRANGNWDANLGGKSAAGGELVQDGPDMTITKAGTYTIALSTGLLDAKGKATVSSFTIK